MLPEYTEILGEVEMTANDDVHFSGRELWTIEGLWRRTEGGFNSGMQFSTASTGTLFRFVLVNSLFERRIKVQHGMICLNFICLLNHWNRILSPNNDPT